MAEQRLHDLTPAVEAFAKAVELNPQNDTMRNGYAELLIETRQPERAIEQAQQVLAHNPTDSAAAMTIGQAYLKMGEYAKAEKAYRDVVTADPSSVAGHYDLGIALKMQDQIEAAQKELQRVIELDPTLAEAHYTLGITNWQAGDFPATISSNESGPRPSPRLCRSPLHAGNSRSNRAGDLDGAMAELKASIKLDPHHTWPLQHARPNPANQRRQKGQ